VHEAYIRLVEAECRNWNSRNHFFMAAAEAMRRILIENARRKKNLKHGGGRQRVDFDDTAAAVSRASPRLRSGQTCPRFEGGTPSTRSDDLIALDEALAKLAAEDPTKVDLGKLRYFAGLSIDQAAEVLGISHATAVRHWSFARAWLFQCINKSR
jgi:RNA polymerase sigma factor (TIGR02999 family)